MMALRAKNLKTEMRENDKNRLSGAETGLNLSVTDLVVSDGQILTTEFTFFDKNLWYFPTHGTCI